MRINYEILNQGFKIKVDISDVDIKLEDEDTSCPILYCPSYLQTSEILTFS